MYSRRPLRRTATRAKGLRRPAWEHMEKLHIRPMRH